MWTLACSRNWWAESPGSLPYRAERPMEVAWSSRTASSKQQNSPSWCSGCWAGIAGGQCDWTGNSWLISNAKRNSIGGKSRDKQPKRNTEMLPGHVGTELGKLKLSWSWNWWGFWSMSRLFLHATQGRPRKMWALCWMRQLMKIMGKGSSVQHFVLVFMSKICFWLSMHSGRAWGRRWYMH